ncbi:hypothetical protein GEMRC1_014215 [Eukaryota sp. GEM-RC1]
MSNTGKITSFGCFSVQDFKLSVYSDHSDLRLLDFDQELFFSSLVFVFSNITVTSKFPVISKSVDLDEESFKLGSGPLLDLSIILSNISISPSQHCCNTSFCHVSLHYKDIGYLSELLDLSERNNNEFSHNFRLNSLDFFFK